MKREQIKAQLVEIITNNCNSDEMPDDYSGKSLIEDIGMDSVALMQMVVDMEEQFSISFDNTENLLELLDDFDILLDTVVEMAGGVYE